LTRHPSRATRHPSPGITPFGEVSTGKPGEVLIPKDADERMIYARRIVAGRCLYGVDKNPLAVEMAKLSLWLLTLAKDKPFTFLDHAVRPGDSLVGISSIDQLLRFSLSDNAPVRPFFQQQRQQIENRLNAVRLLRKQIEDQPSNTPQDIERKTLMLKNAEEQTRRLTYAADLLLAASWEPMSDSERETAQNSTLVEVEFKFKDLPVEQLDVDAKQRLRKAGVAERFHWPLEFPEVFERRGFDAFVCNPPFMGGKKISPALGDSYLAFLKDRWSHASGSADLCAFFFLVANQLLRQNGAFGLIATNTIAQGDTRELGLDFITMCGSTLYRAIQSQAWPGMASVFVSIVHASKSKWGGVCILNDLPVPLITSLLDSAEGNAMPHRLASNASLCGQGAIIFGDGFTLTIDEAKRLLREDPSNKDVLCPYLGGKELYEDCKQRPQRWVINFFDWPIEEAKRYKACFAKVDELVRPLRETVKRKAYRERWWQYAERQARLLDRTSRLKQVLVKAKTSKTWAFAFISPDVVYSTAIIGFVMDRYSQFANLQSTIHQVWAERYASSLKSDMAYTPTDCFENFPLVSSFQSLEKVGELYYSTRAGHLIGRQEGLTATYNRFHDADETADDIQRLRDLHVEMDKAVAAAYGWTDLDLGHGFRPTKLGVRFTISESARREVLARLLKLNHERYAEEVRQGLHDKGKKKAASRKRPPTRKHSGGPTFF
jgi:hypothetical protein